MRMLQLNPDSRVMDGGKDASQPNLESFQFSFKLPSRRSYFELDSNPPDEDCSASLTGSVQDFPVEFGRTYHAYKAGSYAFPNDLLEQDRLKIQSQAILKLFRGRIFFAPLNQLQPPRYVLDVATGLGDWAIQMGDLFPSSEIIATDLSPIQPDQVPPNVKFYVEDSSEPWEYSHKFDYIHTRGTGGCWSSFEKQVVQQAYDALEPGGYLESQEFDSSVSCDDGTLDPEGPLARWMGDITAAAEQCNRPTVMGPAMREAFQRVGFVDVREVMFKIPTNAWPKDEDLKELGRLWEANMTTGLSGFSLRLFSRAFARTPEETEVSLVDVRREMSDTRIHAWMPCFVVWGRKPHAGEMAT
ncbi:uncharacterized protein UV8b_00355 [Ustilaginoidea virens]|uniref:TAM domain methyltransferase n=1 Tax=Ustilaginoidea virens TaxID=1159556 RepID=A0A8E5HIL0_USTVR|nr:uncharacterized protein UV8b_00355 [Ustilaginoidea virens]QUC16114.1 hypothetical protein UV8b_00355 [Ustilaginoidea virens]